MAGLLDQIYNQILPGPIKNPYPGMLSDEAYQQHRKQQLGQKISQAGDFLARASMGSAGGGQGGASGQAGLLNMMKMHQAQQEQKQKAARDQAYQKALY